MSTSRSINGIIRHLFIRRLFPSFISALFYFIPSKKGTLLLIKTDGIGDYILFRNFIAFLRQSPKYANHKISLLTNDVYFDWAAHLEKDNIEFVYSCHDGLFSKWNVIKLIIKLQVLRPETIIYPNYSRKYLIDWLISRVKARHKIGMYSNVANQPASSVAQSNRFYTQLIESSQEHLHEFDRNKLFFEKITNHKSHIEKPFINYEQLHRFKEEYVVVFIGGSDKAKKWHYSKFAMLCKMLINEKKIGVVIAGGNNEVHDSKLIVQEVESNMVTNLTGQLTLEGLTGLISGAEVIITGDTVALHLAVATDTPAICLHKGDFYGRFVPYPSHITNQVATILPINHTIKNCSYNHLSQADINTIQVDEVYKTAVASMSQKMQN